MKTHLLLFAASAFLVLNAGAQCLTVTCTSPISANTDPGVCGATVTYSMPVANSTCTGTVSDTFFYSGAMQTYVVPAGVTTVTIETWGAQGGANWVNDVNYGGYVKGDFPVTPGETLYVYVGQQPNGITGGFNGGGNGEGAGQGGGGATDVRQGGNTLNDRIVVAGGAGGGGYWSSLEVAGGLGGGLNGGNGYRAPDYATNPGGDGATQTSSGNGTCVSFNNPAMAGGFGYGGAPSGCGCEGYGGGGGWYGGAGSGNCRGGGGGSGYVLPIAANTSMLTGVRVGNGMAVISFNGSSAPVVTQTAGLASGSFFPTGTTVNTFLAYDAFGDSATCSFAITVTDAELPVVTCPADITLPADSGMCSSSAAIGSATATDNCAVASVTSDAPSVFPAGTTTVTWTSIDVNGNSATCTQLVTVVDQEAPIFTCPGSISACAGVVNFQSPQATDNCSAVTVVQTSGPVSGSTLTAGTYPVVFTATDTSNNSSTCSFTITVMPTPAVTLNLTMPPIVCVNDSSYALSGGTPAGGNWSGTGVSGASFDPSAAGTGTFAIQYTYVDSNGCSGNAIDSVTVSLCTGINEAGATAFQLFPNPASGSFWFISGGDNGTFELIDVNGKTVHTQRITSAKQEISISDLAAGVYLVRFTTAKNIVTGRLIVK